MSRRAPGPDWSDARLEAAFHARFDREPPNGLVDQVRRALSAKDAGPAQHRWRLASALGRRTSALGGLAALAVLAIAASAVWLGSSRDGQPGSFEPTTSTPPSTAPGQIWPAEVTIAGPDGTEPVVSVADAIAIRDGDPSAREIAVGGWFEQNAVPCLARFDSTSPLESCGVDYTWLMAAPEQLSQEMSRGTVLIRSPVGPSINPVLAFVDWSARTDGQAFPVVFVGHFHDTRAADCPAGDRRDRCEDRFVVDSVPWTSSSSDELAGFPSKTAGLSVVSVPDAVAMRATGSAEELAVAGWFQAPDGPLACPFQPVTGVPALQPGCSTSFTWLMAAPESLTTLSPDGAIEMSAPTGRAIHPVFPAVTPPTPNPVPPSGASTPLPVVFVGHFNDRRSPLCTSESADPEEDGTTACRKRFVVDAIAWVNGTDRPVETLDRRQATDPHPTPMLDPLGSLLGNGTVLGMLVIPGDRIGQLEPELARSPTDLSSETSLWIVTVLDPNPMPTFYKGVYIAGPRDRTLVFTPRCNFFENTGTGFEEHAIFCALVPQAS